MKLSEMSTQNASACLVELVPIFAVLFKNPKVKEYFEKAKNREANMQLAMDAFAELLPIFLRDHYAEVVKVLSILTGKTAAQINEQPFKQTFDDAKSVFDADLVGFFS